MSDHWPDEIPDERWAAWVYEWPDDDDPKAHGEECTCETCIQDHPERNSLLDDGDEEPFCCTCISSGHWEECESCDHGWVESEDDDYELLDRCQWCDGKGGWWVCLGSAHHDLEPGSPHRVPWYERPLDYAI